MRKLLTILLFTAVFLAPSFAQTNYARMLSGVNAQTGTSYTFQASDVTKVVTFSNGAATAVTLPNGAISGFGAGTVFSAHNLGAGTVTITCTGCTINGNTTIVLNTSNGADLYSDGVNYVANSSASGSSWANLAGGTNTSSAFLLGGTASLAPTGSGQNISTANWLLPGGAGLFAPIPVVTGALTGGSLPTGNNLYIQITLSNVIGESLPSVELVFPTNAGNNCASGAACSATVTAPTLLSGQTYTVYSSLGTIGGERKQLAGNACVNITGNCVIQTQGLGAVPPTSNTSVAATPANPQTSECPAGVNPSLWVQGSTGLNRTAAGIDTVTTFGAVPGLGFLEFCRPVIFNLGGAPLQFTANGAITILNTVNPSSSSAHTLPMEIITGNTFSDSTSYNNSWLGLYSETDIAGTATLNQPEPPSSIRGVWADLRSTPAAGAALRSGVSATSEHNGTISVPYDGYTGVYAEATNLNATAMNQENLVFPGFVGVVGRASVGGGATDALGVAVEAKVPAIRFNRNYGFFARDFGTDTRDYALFLWADVLNSSRSYIGGPVYLEQGVNAGLGVNSQLGTSPTIATLTPTCVSSCTTNWGYKLVAKDRNGAPAIAGAQTFIANGAATLNGSNFNTIIPNGGSSAGTNPGIYSFDVYRTVAAGTPASLGKIGNIPYPHTVAFVDNGIAADGTTPSTVDQSGSIGGYGYTTNTDCAVNSVSPAACGAASSGAFVVPTTTTTYTVNTTAVSNHVHILLTPRSSNNGLTGTPTCVLPAVTSAWGWSAMVPYVSFTLALPSTTGTTCWDYWIVSNP